MEYQNDIPKSQGETEMNLSLVKRVQRLNFATSESLDRNFWNSIDERAYLENEIESMNKEIIQLAAERKCKDNNEIEIQSKEA